MQPGYLLRNRYRIEKALAAGGFGETYLAIDLDFPGQRQVVVKHLKPQSNVPRELEVARRLFETEAMTLAKLGDSTDRIPALYAYFEEQGEFYLVQEFIAGKTLKDELGNRQLSELEMLKILQEILVGLNEVHFQNVIHRDLKPDNIIRRASNQQLVLIDFGAVKAVRQATSFVVSQTIGIGTPGYTPGEQGIGKPQLASDIYAVGAIALQCLTGTHPYYLLDDVTSEFKWQDQRSVSAPVTELLQQMVAVHHVDRFANARIAKDAVDRLLATISNSPFPQSRHRVPSTPTYNPPLRLGGKNPVGRKTFLKWLVFGGLGGPLAMVLSQWGKNSSLGDSTALPTADTLSEPGKDPKLTVVQFASVQLDNTGQILDRPNGSAAVFTEDLGGGVGLTMVKILAGKFVMGSPDSEQERGIYEGPQYQETVPEFYLGQSLVTQAQWQAMMGNNPSYFTGDDQLPVEKVSWVEAMEFCDKLSDKLGRNYRLPSEAEWEYACRAGTTTPFAFGEAITPAVVNYDGNYPYGNAAKGEYRQQTTPVRSFPPNGFGLYDMHGNLWEWCLDEWFQSYSGTPMNGSARGDSKSRDSSKKRLLRGGAWDDYANSCRAANRRNIIASNRINGIGFRVVSGPSNPPSRQRS